MLRAGINPKVVSERLGHAKVSITLDTYSHVLPDLQREAAAAMDRTVPDVIVSDIGLPFEDGYALIRRIRQRSAQAGGDVPAIALTAYAGQIDREKALAAGYQAHVAKPFDPSALVALVRRLGGTRTHGARA